MSVKKGSTCLGTNETLQSQRNKKQNSEKTLRCTGSTERKLKGNSIPDSNLWVSVLPCTLIDISNLSQIIADSDEQQEAKEYSRKEMTSKLNDEKLLKHLMPEDFAIGCRRPTPGNGYLEALTKDNVRVVTEEIDQVVSDGIQLKSTEIIKVDALICATGFDLSFCPRFDLIGRNGQDIHEKWKDLPEAYLSLAVPDFPNYFSR